MEIIRIVSLIACIVAIGAIIVGHFWEKRKRTQPENRFFSSTVDKEKEDLKFTLDSVNSWLNNCDQKVGILLAVVGVAITVILTSDFMYYLRSYIFAPFLDYCSGDTDLTFSWGRFSVFILLAIAIVVLIVCCIYLFRAISANIDYDKMYRENPELAKTSFIHFGTISQMKYTDFRMGGIGFEEDLKSQIYVNSIIATMKFRNYKEGLFWFKLLLLVSVFLFFAIMFLK